MSAEQIILAVSVLGGIVGGMGMGGGTLLIPLLTVCAGIEQHTAQAINLMAFIPMSVVALCIHVKNGYVNFKSALPIGGIAVIGAVCGSLLAGYAASGVLRICFGAFLIALGVFSLVKTIIGAVRSHRADKIEKYGVSSDSNALGDHGTRHL